MKQRTIAEIGKLKYQRQNLNIDPNYKQNVENLDVVKYQMTLIQGKLSNVKLRQQLIQDSQKQIQSTKSAIDIEELRSLYEEADSFSSEINIAFDELVNYHNQMIASRIEFIGQELPELNKEATRLSSKLNELENKSSDLARQVRNSNTNADLENISERLGELYQDQGRLDEQITQVKHSKDTVKELENNLTTIDNSAYSKENERLVFEKTSKFSEYFSKMSKKLYNEEFGITSDIRINKSTGKQYYDFSTFEYKVNNSSSGKKQGEIAAFDLAYILFARKYEIPVLDFVLYDKKELMDDHQLVKIAEVAKENNIQVIMPMLSDKLSPEVKEQGHTVLKLSQSDRLFKF